MNNPTYADVVQACKRYDTAMQQIGNRQGVKFILLPQQKKVVERGIMDTHKINSMARRGSKLKWWQKKAT
jgi:hypothetical protein